MVGAEVGRGLWWHVHISVEIPLFHKVNYRMPASTVREVKFVNSL